MESEDLSLPTLPPLLQSASDLVLPSHQTRPRFPCLQSNPRKRPAHGDCDLYDSDAVSTSLHTSSDPALFSSDETPDAENYAGGKRRKKKTYAGTWWGEKHRQPRARADSGYGKGSITPGSESSGIVTRSASKIATNKRKFTRNFDSGIFMNSDDGDGSATELSSDASFGDALMEEQRRHGNGFDLSTRYESPVKKLLDASPVRLIGTTSASVSPQRLRVVRQPIRSVDNRDDRVRAIVRACLDNSKEDVNLSTMGLESLPIEVRELSTMVKDDPADQGQFDSLVARPRLYLSVNSLRNFPLPILDVTNLRLLSLRQNKITRLPPGIRNLIKLETLNIAGNRLQSLPIELLELLRNGRLAELHCEPNPWRQYRESQTERTNEPSRLPHRALVRSGRQQAVDVEIHLDIVASGERPLTSPTGGLLGSRSRVSPLYEQVLRQLSKINSAKRNLAALMPKSTASEVTDRLHDLHTAQSEGNRHCASCDRLHVVPADQWTEWWSIEISTDTAGEPPATVEQHMAGYYVSGCTTSIVVPFEVGICDSCT